MIFDKAFAQKQVDLEKHWSLHEQDLSHLPNLNEITQKQFVSAHLIGDIQRSKENVSLVLQSKETIFFWNKTQKQDLCQDNNLNN